MKRFAIVAVILSVLTFPGITRAQCADGSCAVGGPARRAVAAPVRVLRVVKPVRRVARLPVRLLKRLCVHHRQVAVEVTESCSVEE